MEKLSWSGGTAPFLDRPVVEAIGRVSMGRWGGYGGKNEDGALVWSGDDWTLAAILDGHAGSTSVEAVLALVGDAEDRLVPLCATGAVLALQRELITLFTSEATGHQMSEIRGETACLVAYQHGPQLLWLSIGDNTLYLLHPELARLGQHTLTTRNFFEWIGERSSLSGSVPYFSTASASCGKGGARSCSSPTASRKCPPHRSSRLPPSRRPSARVPALCTACWIKHRRPVPATAAR